MLFRVKDRVIVLAGRDKGQRGVILEIDREKNRVVVEGLNKIYKHVRKSNRNPQGGRLSKELGIDASNVAIVDPELDIASRIGIRFLEDGSKERYSKKSGKSLGVISPPRPGKSAKK